MRLVEPRLRWEDPVVDLALPARDAAPDPPELELLGGERRLEPGIKRLAGAGPVRCEAARTAEDLGNRQLADSYRRRGEAVEKR